MSNWPSGHPEEGLLLRSLDGELPARKARQVRKHLEACWQCRAEMESLEATVAECVRYRKQVLAGLLPEAPNAWQRLDRGFDRGTTLPPVFLFKTLRSISDLRLAACL